MAKVIRQRELLASFPFVGDHALDGVSADAAGLRGELVRFHFIAPSFPAFAKLGEDFEVSFGRIFFASGCALSTAHATAFRETRVHLVDFAVQPLQTVARREEFTCLKFRVNVSHM